MLQRKLGSNRFILCVQLYSFFEDYFKLAAGDIQLDLQRVVNSGNEFNDKQIIHLKMKIFDVVLLLLNTWLAKMRHCRCNKHVW